MAIGILALGLLALVATAAATPTEAAFPGANGKIAFTSDRDGNEEVYVMDADGTGQTNLTNNPALDRDPAWSPDGSHIAFHSARDGNAEVYIMNADGTGQTNLTNNPATDYQPAWSPDGSKIAFISGRDGNSEVYVMNADGSGQTNLTNNAVSDYHPAWSPDGSKIAFTHWSSGDHSEEVYITNADGTGETNLTNNAASDRDPAWSPDGSKIAFSSSRDGHFQIYVMNADGLGPTALTSSQPWNGGPAWSPDGSKIAFDSGRDANSEVYLMNADGSGQTRLTNNPAYDCCPDWQPLPAAELAKAVVGAPYLGDGETYGGKGWDCAESRYVEPAEIEQGYYYYDHRPAYRTCSASVNPPFQGQGLDCSGLVYWAYNRAGNATTQFDGPIPINLGAGKQSGAGAIGQYKYHFTLEVAEEDLLPGDLLFFQGNPWHVVMYVGPGDSCGDVVHAHLEPQASGIDCEQKEDVISRLVQNGMVFKGYRRYSGSPIGIVFTSSSPVDLIVTDPDGYTVTKDVHEVPGHFYYLEFDVEADGDPHDIVTGLERKMGIYNTTVVPEPDADPTDTYSLTAEAAGSTIVLAQDVQITDIPSGGYTIASTETGISEVRPVGGIAELPDAPGSSAPNYALLAGTIAAVALLALGAGRWYARRRWSR